MTCAKPTEDQDTADLDTEVARERAEAERLAGLLWAHVHLSRHTLDGIGASRLRTACEALGLDVNEGR